MRELEVPTQDAQSGARLPDTTEIEKSVRTYLYSPVRRSVSLVVEHALEKENRDARGINESLVASARVHRLSGEIRLFAGPGTFVRFRTTFVDEKGEFQDAEARVVPGTARFWVVDASVGYRLPRQLGVVSIEGRNLFDESFKFQDSSPEESRIQPRRSITARLTIAL